MDRNNIHRCISSYKLKPRTQSDPARGVVRRCSSYCQPSDRSVSFSQEHSHEYVQSLDDMSKEDILAVWFSTQECNAMKDDAIRHVSAIDEGLEDADARGLEERTAAGAWEALQARSQAYNLVLGLQERQKKRQENNPDAIADVYGEQSRMRLEIAQTRAREDEKVAQKYLKTIILEPRRSMRRVPLTTMESHRKDSPRISRAVSLESRGNWASLMRETKGSLRNILSTVEGDETDKKGRRLIKIKIKKSKSQSDLTDSTESTGAISDASESSMWDHFANDDVSSPVIPNRVSVDSCMLTKSKEERKEKKSKKEKHDKKEKKKEKKGTKEKKDKNKEAVQSSSPPRSQVSAAEKASLMSIFTRSHGVA